jgi:hypothetical protein
MASGQLPLAGYPWLLPRAGAGRTGSSSIWARTCTWWAGALDIGSLGV